MFQNDPWVKHAYQTRKPRIPVIIYQNEFQCVYDDKPEKGEPCVAAGETCAFLEKSPELGERVQDLLWQRSR